MLQGPACLASPQCEWQTCSSASCRATRLFHATAANKTHFSEGTPCSCPRHAIQVFKQASKQPSCRSPESSFVCVQFGGLVCSVSFTANRSKGGSAHHPSNLQPTNQPTNIQQPKNSLSLLHLSFIHGSRVCTLLRQRAVRYFIVDFLDINTYYSTYLTIIL